MSHAQWTVSVTYALLLGLVTLMLKSRYGEEWKRPAGSINLLIRKSHSKRRQADSELYLAKEHRWIGHVLRHDGLLHEIIEGSMRGKPAGGRRRIQMLPWGLLE